MRIQASYMKSTFIILISMISISSSIYSQNINSLKDKRIPNELMEKVYSKEFSNAKVDTTIQDVYLTKDTILNSTLEYTLELKINKDGKITGNLEFKEFVKKAGGMQSFQTIERKIYVLEIDEDNIYCCKSKPQICDTWENRKKYQCDVWVIRR